jgi:hypothetical protein
MSHPKTGTMAVRNLILHFVGLQRLYVPVILDIAAVTKDHLAKEFHYGHVAYSERVGRLMRDRLKILIVRDPATTVVTLAKALLDPRNPRPDQVFFQEKGATVKDLIPWVVSGFSIGGIRTAAFAKSYEQFVLDWEGRADVIIDFDELVHARRHMASSGESGQAAAFSELLGVEPPLDARERYIAGLSPRQSPTFMPPLAEDMQEDCLKLASSLLSRYGIERVLPTWHPPETPKTEIGPLETRDLSPGFAAPGPRKSNISLQ